MNYIELAKQAGWTVWFSDDGELEVIERFAKLVAAQEREECAKICDEVGKESASHWPHRFSNMIRARGNT